MCNVEIKELMKVQGVRQWQIAEYIGMNESLLSRKMRHKLEPDLEKLVLEAIEDISNTPGFRKRYHFENYIINK